MGERWSVSFDVKTIWFIRVFHAPISSHLACVLKLLVINRTWYPHCCRKNELRFNNFCLCARVSIATNEMQKDLAKRCLEMWMTAKKAGKIGSDCVGICRIETEPYLKAFYNVFLFIPLSLENEPAAVRFKTANLFHVYCLHECSFVLSTRAPTSECEVCSMELDWHFLWYARTGGWIKWAQKTATIWEDSFFFHVNAHSASNYFILLLWQYHLHQFCVKITETEFFNSLAPSQSDKIWRERCVCERQPIARSNWFYFHSINWIRTHCSVSWKYLLV